MSLKGRVCTLAWLLFCKHRAQNATNFSPSRHHHTCKQHRVKNGQSASVQFLGKCMSTGGGLAQLNTTLAMLDVPGMYRRTLRGG